MDLKKIGFEDITDKVVLITGASNGMGKELSLLLSELGAKCVITARREEKLIEISQNMKSENLVLSFDMQDKEAINSAVETVIEKFGKIDVLVNNAGLGIPTTDLSEADDEAYENMMKTNIDGVFYMTKAVLKYMKKAKEGHIVNISSTAGVTANPVAPLYCTSKFAVEGFSSGLQKQTEQWKEEGINIRVSNIRPGNVDSGYWGDRDVPREKFMTCEEMACVIYWSIASNKTMNIIDITMESKR